MLPKVPIIQKGFDKPDPVYLGNVHVLGFPLLHYIAEKHKIIVLRRSASQLSQELINSGHGFGELVLVVNWPGSKRGH